MFASVSRTRSESGFGLIELLAAMSVLAIAMGALLAVFAAGVSSTRRAGLKSTATVLAERQLELFHKARWEEIHVNSAMIATAPTPYGETPPNPQPSETQVTDGAVYPFVFVQGTVTTTNTYTEDSDDDVTVGAMEEFQVASYPWQIVEGADGKKYRVDTYVFMDGSNNEVKNVTVYVYDYTAGSLVSTTPLAKATASLNRWQFVPQPRIQ